MKFLQIVSIVGHLPLLHLENEIISNYIVRATKTLIFTGIGKAEPAFVEEKCFNSSNYRITPVLSDICRER